MFTFSSEKVNKNREPMHHYTRVEGGDSHWKLYWLPVVTGVDEGGRIAWAWIEDPKGYPGYQCPNDGIHAKEDVLLKCWGFVDNTLVTFPPKKHQQFKIPPNTV